MSACSPAFASRCADRACFIKRRISQPFLRTSGEMKLWAVAILIGRLVMRKSGPAKKRRVGLFAWREGEHGHGGEAGVLHQLTEAEVKVVKHRKEDPSEFRDVAEGSELRRIPARTSAIQENG